MAYTTAQLTTFFTNANAGTGPSAAQTLTLTALANQNAAGTLTDAQALGQTIDLASDITTAVAVETYAFFTGVAPSQAGIAAINAAFVGTGAQAGLNGENRFIAQSVALALGNPAAKTAFAASYGVGTIADATKAAYNVIIGNAAAAAAGINVDSAVAFLTSTASVNYYTAYVKANTPNLSTADLDLAVRAAIVGEIMYLATTYNNGAGIGSYATATTNLIKDLSDDGSLTANNSAGINLFAAYGSSGTGTPGTPGSSFALKVGLDALVGTANDDTFVGTLDAAGATSTTLNFGDSIDGGSGTDTLNILSNVTTTQNLSGLSLKSVENVLVTNTVAGTGAAITVDATGFSGVSKIAAGGVGDLTVTNIGSVTLGVSGTTTNGTVGTKASAGPPVVVKVDPTIVTQTVKATGATSADVTGTTQNAAGNLVVDVSGGSATTFSLRNTGGTAATVSQLALATTTKTLNVAATSGITLNGLAADAGDGTSPRGATTSITGTGALEAINVSGVGAVSLGTLAAAALKTVDASASTGGLTASFGSSALTSVKGSTVADTIALTGTLGATAVVDLGAGNDTLTISNALTVGATVNGGDGTDTLGLAASGLIDGTSKTQFVGFENVAISGTSSYDVANLSGFANIQVAGGDVTLTNVGANATFAVTANTTTLTTTLTNATGTSDVVNLNLGVAGKSGATVGTFVAAGVETVNVNSIAGSSSSSNGITFGAGNTTLKTVNVTGAGPLTLSVAAVTSGAIDINASTATGSLTATGSTTKVTNIIGTGVNDTITAGGVGGSINSGKGGDAITLGAGNDVVILKGGDSVYDAVNVTAASTGAGNKGTMDVITGFTAGADKIDLTQISGFTGSAQGVAQGSAADVAALTTLVAGTTFKDGGGLTRGVLQVVVGADSYVVVDVDHNGTYSSADLVVKMIGVTAPLTSTDFNFGS